MLVPKIYTKARRRVRGLQLHFSEVSGLKKNKDSDYKTWMLLMAKIKLSEMLKLHTSFQPDAGSSFSRESKFPVAQEHKQMVRYAPLQTRSHQLHEGHRGGHVDAACQPPRRRRADGITFLKLLSSLLTKSRKDGWWKDFREVTSWVFKYLRFMEGIALGGKHGLPFLCVALLGTGPFRTCKDFFFFLNGLFISAWVQPSFLRHRALLALNPGEESRTLEPLGKRRWLCLSRHQLVGTIF